MITAQDRMATVINANQEMMEAKMKIVLGELSSFKQTEVILTQGLEVKSEALTKSADLKAAHDKVKELQSVVAEQKDKIQRLLRRIDNYSEGNQLVKCSRKNVTTASQTSENIAHHSLQLREAADKIRKLEDELWNKRKYVTELKNKLTRERLRTRDDMRAKDNTSNLEKNSNAQGQGTVDNGLKDAPIIEDQIKEDAGIHNQGTKHCAFYPPFQGQILKPETSLNNQEHRQLQLETESLDPKCTPHVHGTETSCASNQLQSSVEEQRS
jgi:hypothetical protein